MEKSPKSRGRTKNGWVAGVYDPLFARRKRILTRRILLVGVAAVGTMVLCAVSGAWSWLVAGAGVVLVGFFLAIRNEADAQVSIGSPAMLEKLTESLPGMVYQCRLYPSGKCVITFANEAIEWIYEKRLEDVQHDCSSLLDLVHPEDRPEVEHSLRESMKHLTPWKGEYRVFLPRQGLQWRSAHARVERLMDGSTLWHGFVADITVKKTAEEVARVESLERALKEAREAAILAERKKLERLANLNRDLEEQATHDGLTGVYTRRYFDDGFAEIFGRMRRRHEPMTLIFCDIDDFKTYNDSFGHQAGDACLMAVARAMSTQVNREGQILARYGGEEFVAVLPGLGPDRAGVVAEKMREAVASLDLKRGLGNKARTVTVSVGVATVYPITKAMRPGMLLHKADMALYEAKHSGKNRVCHRQLLPEDGVAPLRDDRSFSPPPEGLPAVVG